MNNSLLKVHQYLVWCKNNHVLGMNDYQYKFLSEIENDSKALYEPFLINSIGFGITILYLVERDCFKVYGKIT